MRTQRRFALKDQMEPRRSRKRRPKLPFAHRTGRKPTPPHPQPKSPARHPIALRKYRAQALVPSNHIPQRSFQRPLNPIHRAAEPPAGSCSRCDGALPQDAPHEADACAARDFVERAARAAHATTRSRWRFGCAVKLDLAALEAALGDVVARHESLRTVFAERDGVPRQRFGCGCGGGWASGLCGGAKGAGAALSAAARFHLILSAKRRACACVCAWGERACAFACAASHCGDGWSLAPLARDVSGELCGAVCGSLAPSFCAGCTNMRTTRFGSRGFWGRRGCASALSRSLLFWRDRLAVSRADRLPFDRPRPAVSSYRGGRVEFGGFGGGLHAGLLRLARGEGAEPVHGAAGWSCRAADAAWCGERPCDRQPDRGSHGQRAGRSVGFFVNTLVLRTTTSGNPSLRESDGTGAGKQSFGYSHRMCRLSVWLRCSTLRARCRTIHCSGDACVAEQRAGSSGACGTERELRRFKREREVRPVGERCGTSALRRGAGRGSAGDEYRQRLFEAGSVEARLIGSFFLRFLEGAVASPDSGDGRLELLSALSGRRLLEDGNPTGRAVCRRRCPAAVCGAGGGRGRMRLRCVRG